MGDGSKESEFSGILKDVVVGKDDNTLPKDSCCTCRFNSNRPNPIVSASHCTEPLYVLQDRRKSTCNGITRWEASDEYIRKLMD